MLWCPCLCQAHLEALKTFRMGKDLKVSIGKTKLTVCNTTQTHQFPFDWELVECVKSSIYLQITLKILHFSMTEARSAHDIAAYLQKQHAHIYCQELSPKLWFFVHVLPQQSLMVITGT